MLNYIGNIGRYCITFVSKIGRAGLLLGQTLWRRPQPIKGFPLLLEQLYSVGVLSLLIIIVSGLFVGMVIALQGYNTLVKFGAEAELGTVLALTIMRELAPVMTALLFAGRAGSALTAEIGLMKATEQLSSLEVIGVDPVWRVVSPRFWAGIISMPLLAIIFNAAAILGGAALSISWLHIDAGNFWASMQANVNFHEDFLNGILKSIVFGLAIIWIAIYQGMDSEPTAEGMGRATTRTVVYSSLVILGLDFILTSMMMGGW
jgi:phospholipid/cholesterol/gamma-HCH transport system permease protein